MIVFPNCKINLGLNIIRKRNDGYHDLETVFYPVALQDALEIVELDQSHASAEMFVKFSTSGEAIAGKPDDNLCVKAATLLKNKFPSLPPLMMHLHKAIPPGSGLGGGSADGAFALRLINQKFNLGLTIEQLLDCALQLGSDCPFFIINRPCVATGRGEFLEHVTIDLSPYKMVIVMPRIHVNTTEAFSLINPARQSKSIQEIIQQPISTWVGELKNDFEDGISKKYPEVREIKDRLYNAGAVYSSMTGSGSAVYGIFPRDVVTHLWFSSKYVVKELVSKTQ